MKLIYLASPYSHLDQSVVESRFRAACEAAWTMMQRGYVVFSPIAHSHAIAGSDVGKRMAHDFWMRQDLEIIRRCDEIVVLMLYGWKESKGVKMEIDFALANSIPVKYLFKEDVACI